MTWNNSFVGTEAQTIAVRIWIGGSVDVIKQTCREYVTDVGQCVTVTPTTYIFRGGEESGVVVGLLNYPRFPSSLEDLESHAQKLAHLLALRACQGSYSIESPNGTTWYSRRGSIETSSS